MNKCRQAAALAFLFASLTQIAAAQVISEFSGPRSASEPLQITSGPGGMWFTELAANRIGLMTFDGKLVEFRVPRPPIAIVSGPDGNLWFTSTGFVSRMTPSGVVADFPVNQFSLDGYPSSITVGPDGRLWFADADVEGGRIGQVTVSGQVTSDYIQAPDVSDPTTIRPGPDGNIWFTVFGLNGDGKIGRVTPSGVVTLFPVPGAKGIWALSGGPDGNLWFSETNTSKIGRITPSGAITEFSVAGNPRGIAAGYDGNLWFTETGGNKIGRITTRGEYSEFAVPTSDAEPWGVAAGSDGNIWFTERGTGQIGKVRTDDANPYALRLGGGRFDIQVYWVSPADEGNLDGGGMGRPVLLTSDAGYFWFTDPANVEVVVKVLNWCPDGDIKFLAAGLTNFRVEMDVTDTQSGLTKHYGNPQGVAFRPIQDTFSSCPPGNIAGAWTGTYNGISNRCNTDAQARFEQTGSAVSGELRTTGSCGLAVGFSGTLQGNTLAGSVTDGEIFSGDARGILSGSTLEVTIMDSSGVNVAQFHLHR